MEATNLNDALLEILNKTVSAASTGVDFLKEQIPDVIHQLLLWHAVRSGIFFGIGVLLLIGSVYFLKLAGYYYKKNADEGTCYSDPYVGHILIFAIAGIVSVVVGFAVSTNNLDWLQIIIAPKLYLIEYAAHLIKK